MQTDGVRVIERKDVERANQEERTSWVGRGRWIVKDDVGWTATLAADNDRIYTLYTHTAYTRHWLVTIITELCSATSDRLQLITVTIDRQLRDRGSTVPNTELGAARLELSGVGLNLA